jgi:hypothetical protein
MYGLDMLPHGLKKRSRHVYFPTEPIDTVLILDYSLVEGAPCTSKPDALKSLFLQKAINRGAERNFSVS